MHRIRLFAVATAVILAGVAAWAASTTNARTQPAPGSSIDIAQMTRNATNLPASHYVDYTFVFN